MRGKGREVEGVEDERTQRRVKNWVNAGNGLAIVEGCFSHAMPVDGRLSW